MNPGMLFVDYFEEWIRTYKEGAVRPTSLLCYENFHRHLKRLAPDLTMGDLNKRTYQQIINRFAANHARITTGYFHAMLRASIMDALDEEMIAVNPTSRVVIKGLPRKERRNYLGVEEAAALVEALDLTVPIIRPLEEKHTRGQEMTTNWDWFIFLCLGTGARYSEALAVTPGDFDFPNRTLRLNKTYDYKISNDLFMGMKSKASERHIGIDCKMAGDFKRALVGLDPERPIFVPEGQRVFNSAVINRLHALCGQCGIPEIGVHALRHTHASILLYSGVSINAISKRLGHSKISITQDVYLHIIKELDEKENTAIGNCMEAVYGGK